MTEHHLPDDLPPELRDIPVELWVHAPNTWAGFCPSEGFNCTAFRVLLDGVWQPILSEPPSWEAIRSRPSWYGMPILAPWVFGMARDVLVFQGERHPLAPGKEGHANHGFSRDYAWTVDDVYQSDAGAIVSGNLAAGLEDAASQALLDHFPWPVQLRVEYDIRPKQLITFLHIDNLSDATMPAGCGVHPYFDLAPRSGRDDGSLVVRAKMRRLTDRDPALVGTWGYEEDDDASFAMRLSEVVPHLEEGVRMGDLFVRADEPWEDWQHPREPEPPLWLLLDSARGLTISFTARRNVAYISQFIPPDRSVISPVFSSMRHGGHQRAEEGLDSGLATLAPGESWHTTLGMRVNP